MKHPSAVNLHNAVTVSQQRLGRRLAQLSAARMNEVNGPIWSPSFPQIQKELSDRGQSHFASGHFSDSFQGISFV